MTASVTDMAAMTAACAGADAVIHLGGIPARRRGRRSSTSTSTAPTRSSRPPAGPGCRGWSSPRPTTRSGSRRGAASRSPTPPSPRPTPTTGCPRRPARPSPPCTPTGTASTSICVRILSCFDRPRDARALSTWLSPDDAGRLFEACLTAPAPGFRVIFGVSANTRGGWVSLDEARALGYEPRDDAEVYAADVLARTPSPRRPGHRYLGGESPCRTRTSRCPSPLSRPGRR